MRRLTVTLELETLHPLLKRDLQSWFDQRKLEKLGIKGLTVTRVVENGGFQQIEREDS